MSLFGSRAVLNEHAGRDRATPPPLAPEHDRATNHIARRSLDKWRGGIRVFGSGRFGLIIVNLNLAKNNGIGWFPFDLDDVFFNIYIYTVLTPLV
ncbi:hypothetical protein GWI33_004192 [Rhynchophorus ferrugineus]|uniref:Uncharacterized protein n=1 Tax=Rhynchophorus ferrugineus TaxID=354439 RepID=A0A834MLB3_RHYFE|nr:hypothetical protein GWI33_004192 [Rhynchophorus ferrugineus]